MGGDLDSRESFHSGPKGCEILAARHSPIRFQELKERHQISTELRNLLLGNKRENSSAAIWPFEQVPLGARNCRRGHWRCLPI